MDGRPAALRRHALHRHRHRQEKVRYLHLVLESRLIGEHAVALLGHELQHVVEVAGAPWVVDRQSFRAALFDRSGRRVMGQASAMTRRMRCWPAAVCGRSSRTAFALKSLRAEKLTRYFAPLSRVCHAGRAHYETWRSRPARELVPARARDWTRGGRHALHEARERL